MHEGTNSQQAPSPSLWLPGVREGVPGRRGRDLLRRLRLLLVLGGAGFAVATWMMVRFDPLPQLLGGGSGPASVAREHLQALNRGALREAYALFSIQYRAQVSFEAYHELVVTHREMFRTAAMDFTEREASRERAVLEGHLRTAAGERYRARFTMVWFQGRWWIDDLRWGLEPDEENFLRAARTIDTPHGPA